MKRLFMVFVILCAMQAATAGAASFTNNGNGTVTDNGTGLMWQQGEPGSMIWVNALTYCEGLSLGGQTDWRLPNIKELESITDDTKYNPAIDTTYFPNTHADGYWSSTTYASYAGSAWGVGFGRGFVGGYDESGTGYVRCVRGGQSGSLCNLAISPSSQTFTSSGGICDISPCPPGLTGSVTVTASGSSCAWTATSSQSWITITSGSSGTGSGTVTISVAANTTGATRTGTITIAGQTFTITQSAATTDNCAATTSGPPGQIQMPFISYNSLYYSGVLTYQPANTTGIWFALEQFTQVSTPGCTTPATLSNGTLTIPKLTLTTSSGAVVNASVILTSNDGVYYHLTGIY